MFYATFVVHIILIEFVNTTPQINLYLTDFVNENNNNNGLQYNCLYISGDKLTKSIYTSFMNIVHCMGKSTIEFHIEKNDIFPKFTFAELLKENITSEELYLWSAPIDLIERYQFYLNQLSITNDSSLSEDIYYNCTWPRFGSQCQYEIAYYYDYSAFTLEDFIFDSYILHAQLPNYITCYNYLSCNRSFAMNCLDWTDICDGKVDCLNGGIDEENCWQFDVNQCKPDEYRCYNGLCLSKDFLEQEYNDVNLDCIPMHNQYQGKVEIDEPCDLSILDVRCDQMKCFSTFLTSSCSQGQLDFLLEMLYSRKEDYVLDDCWLAFKCLFKIIYTDCDSDDPIELISIIERTCPDLMFIPSVPVLFDEIYFVYIKNSSRNVDDNNPIYLYFHICSNNSVYDVYFVNHSKQIFNNIICYRNISWDIDSSDVYELFKYQFGPLHSYNRFLNYSSIICNRPDMYQCINSSKCISIDRLIDGMYDCPYLDDEQQNPIQNMNLLEYFKQNHFKCPNSNKYIPKIAVNNGACDCEYHDDLWCEDEKLYVFELFPQIKFRNTCNKVLDVPLTIIDGKNETDETECEYWPCDNFYTHCDGVTNCINEDDEKSCQLTKFSEKHIRKYKTKFSSKLISSQTHLTQNLNALKSFNRPLISDPVSVRMFDRDVFYCHTGMDLIVWLDSGKGLSEKICLCPISHYGDQCQYQNQRVNLHIYFNILYNSINTIFATMVSLIDDDDNERVIHSYEQFTFLKTRGCNFNYFITLTYSTRPKDPTKNYSIQIDVYEKLSLGYRGSFLLPIKYSFLPVHRLSQTLSIPRSNDSVIDCFIRQCKHGKCIRYLNNSKDAMFCQCDQGWAGKYCNISYNCTCSADSLCVGVSAHNRSVCVCPINRFGLRCLINDLTCQNNGHSKCQNGGQCIAHEEVKYLYKKFFCICPKGFHGDLCEQSDHNITVSFEENINILSLVYIHFFTQRYSLAAERTTISKTIRIRENSINISWKQMFNLIVIQFVQTDAYYLVAKNFKNSNSQIITKLITLADHCLYISEIVNETIFNYNVLRRQKYYHLLCQTYAYNLSCFYDEIQFCICHNDHQRRYTHCLSSNRNTTSVCQGQSNCYNEGQCFEDNWECPTTIWCICPPCFYGVYCQFSANGFGLSLDSILGYHIQPHIKLIYQPAIIQLTIVLTIIFMIIGFINGILSIITFKNKSVCQVGCGLYLLSSSVNTLLITVVFGLKVSILLITQISLIKNRLFLSIQCYSIDSILRCCVYMDQWLHACVAVERTTITLQGASFNKKKSKKRAKFIILFLLFLNIATNIHDSIYRRIVDEENDNDDIQRKWCIVVYSSDRLSTYNNVINTFHFFTPFLLNLFSVIILIIKKSNQQLNMQTHSNIKTILRKQIQQHKHLLLAPIVLVALSVSRLIITYVTKCMESTSDAWSYLFAYFISLIPAQLTFIIFILPSKFYKKEFRNTVAQYRTNIQRLLNIVS